MDAFMHTPFWRALILFTLALLVKPSAHAQPANNNFSSAWIITGTAVTTNGSNVNATKETGEPNHAGNFGGRSVWFRWTAPVSGLTQIDTSGSSFNTLLAVYTGSAVNALATIASNNDSPQGGTTSLVQFQAVQGTTYQIAVDANRNFGTPTGGNYILHLLVLPVIIAPTNGAIALHGNDIPFSFTTNALSPPINRVELYSSFGVIGTNSTPPYDIVVTNAPLGIDYFAALVWDSAGRVFQTPVIGIYVLDVGVTIIYPPDGTTILNTNPLL